LALYGRQLSAPEIDRHYAGWTSTGRSGVALENEPTAVYHSGEIIHRQAYSGPDLYVPDGYFQVHHSFLKRPLDEYYRLGLLEKRPDQCGAFVPLGFFLCAYLALTLRLQRAALIAILLGGLLSSLVETIQALLPTRDPGMTDIITKTLGTARDFALCHLISIVSDSLSGSGHPGLRRLAGVFTRRGHGQEAAAESVCSRG